MNKLFKSIISATLLAAVSLSLTGCLDEAYPESNQVSKEQLALADKSGLSSAIAAYMTSYTSDYYYDIGFAGFGLWRDAMTADIPGLQTGYYYFTYFASQQTLGDWALQTLFWRRYYYLIQKCDAVLAVSDLTPGSADTDAVGNALAYRAMAYMDLLRFYEYRKTGVADLDATAAERGIFGLTVPIITEKTTESEARNLPRAPYAEMTRFIMTDLENAEKCLAKCRTATAKNYACLGVVYGLKARMWLELGSRFLTDADALALQIAAEGNSDYASLEKLGVSTANECFSKAQTYARKAINEGFTPLSKSQWYDPVNGFNTPNNSWMWAIIIGADDSMATDLTWQSWVSFMSPEATYGTSTMQYKGTKMIDARLFGSIDTRDWRRDTWIAPDEAGDQDAFTSKYAKTTSLTYESWKEFPAYVAFKFHPAGGDGQTSSSGNAVSIPLMRVEEMYLIEAEAAAHAQSPVIGAQLLSNFLTSYRYTAPVTVNASSIDDVVDAIFLNKRIELWGEGLISWDYRRLLKPIERGYVGTNHPESFWFNSYAGFVAPWTTLFIPDREVAQNPAIIPNPDPSQAIPAWVAPEE